MDASSGTIRAGVRPFIIKPMEHPMSDAHYKAVAGKITHVFGHRFVLKTEHGDVLADLTSKGVEQIVLRLNDELHIELGGNIRKTKPVANDDPKWSYELRGAA
jgi:hypothetical protein